MEHRGVRRVLDILLSVLLLGVGILTLMASRDLSRLAAVFPTAIAFGLIGLALTLVVLQLLGRAPGQVRGEFSDEFRDGSNLRRAAFILVMLAWAFIIPWLGFLASSVAAFMAISMLATHGRMSLYGMLRYQAVGMAIIVGFYVLFARLLHVPLPKGILI